MSHRSIFLDDEWLRRVFPLLNRQELRLCALIADKGLRPTSPAELAGALGAPEPTLKRLLVLLTQHGVVFRQALPKGRCRLGFSPDFEQAEQLLRRAGREPGRRRRAA